MFEFDILAGSLAVLNVAETGLFKPTSVAIQLPSTGPPSFSPSLQPTREPTAVPTPSTGSESIENGREVTLFLIIFICGVAGLLLLKVAYNLCLPKNTKAAVQKCVPGCCGGHANGGNVIIVQEKQVDRVLIAKPRSIMPSKKENTRAQKKRRFSTSSVEPSPAQTDPGNAPPPALTARRTLPPLAVVEELIKTVVPEEEETEDGTLW